MIRYQSVEAQEATVIKRLAGCRNDGVLEYLMYRSLPGILQPEFPATCWVDLVWCSGLLNHAARPLGFLAKLARYT